VIINFLLYLALTYMIAREEARERGVAAPPLPRSDPALAPKATSP
jgi:hypothetical protein